MQVDDAHVPLARAQVCPSSPPSTPAMPSFGTKVPILEPMRVKKGYFFKTCRPYRSSSGILYEYKLYNSRGQELQLQLRGRTLKK